jgi:hypothetical protein
MPFDGSTNSPKNGLRRASRTDLSTNRQASSTREAPELSIMPRYSERVFGEENSTHIMCEQETNG